MEATPPTRETLIMRWALLLVPCLLVPFVIWGILDVPEDYDACNEDPPLGQEGDLNSFRQVAFPLVGLLVVWLTVLFARFAFERERRVGHPYGRAVIGLIAFVWAALTMLALGAADTPVGLVITAALFAGAFSAAAGAVLALLAPAFISRADHSRAGAERGDRVILLLAAALLTATPILAVAASLSGSDFVIGC